MISDHYYLTLYFGTDAGYSIFANEVKFSITSQMSFWFSNAHMANFFVEASILNNDALNMCGFV